MPRTLTKRPIYPNEFTIHAFVGFNDIMNTLCLTDEVIIGRANNYPFVIWHFSMQIAEMFAVDGQHRSIIRNGKIEYSIVGCLPCL